MYELDRYKEQIVQENGFGIRSFERLQKAIASSRKTTLNRFIAAMGIHEVGRTAGRTISDYFGGSWLAFEKALQDGFDFTVLEDFGQTMNDSIYEWYADKQAAALWRPALYHIEFIIQEKERHTMSNNNVFSGQENRSDGKTGRVYTHRDPGQDIELGGNAAERSVQNHGLSDCRRKGRQQTGKRAAAWCAGSDGRRIRADDRMTDKINDGNGFC